MSKKLPFPMRLAFAPRWFLSITVLAVLGTSASAQAQDEDLDEGPAAPSAEKLRPFPVIDTGAQAGFRTGFAMGMGNSPPSPAN